jgi:hypothetical protein
MTYNFDPDAWYERERAALDRRLRSGEIDEDRFRAALEDLDRRYQAMVERLDGTYRLPEPPSHPST